MKYKCLVVEDNMLERDALEVILKKIDNITVQACLSDGVQAVSYLKQHEIDIVFSDIDMPDLSGLELLRSMKHPPVFIFISAHSEHAAESFNLDVIDYIVKPAKLDRVIKATHKAIEYIEAKSKAVAESTRPQPQLAVEYVKSIDAHEYFFVKEKNAYVKVDMGDVLFIESMGDFSRIMTHSQRSHFILVSLKNLEKQLPEKLFLRVHKQYIINILHVANISSAEIRLSNKTVVPISPVYRQQLLEEVVQKKTLTRFGE
jgi:DNA-binding LytR/AlgR family response regulator